MVTNILKKAIIVGIILLLLGSSFVTSISGISNDIEQTENNNDGDSNLLEDVTVSCSTYGISNSLSREIEMSYAEAEKLMDKINELSTQIAYNPSSAETDQLQQEIMAIAKDYNLIPEDISLEDLKPHFISSLNTENPKKGIIPTTGIRGTAALCNFATTGEGSQFPIIILPRLIPILLIPIPRLFLHWSSLDGITSCGSYLTGTGFIAGGKQTGTAIGFWGIGFSIFLPPVMAYGFFGYALFATCAADIMEPWPPNYAPEVSPVFPQNGATNVPISTSELSFRISDENGDKMEYTVTTDPDIGSGGGSKKDGTYSIPISGLEGSEEYTWKVEVSDGQKFTVETFKFSTEEVAPIVSDPKPGDGAKNVNMPLNQISFYLEDPQGDLMDYTVETSPDIGSDSGKGVSQGLYTVDVNTVDYYTDYVWFVNVTDGTNWKHKVYDFKTRPIPAPWWNDEWSFRKEIIVNYEMVEGNHDNFPVLVKLDADIDLSAHAQADGDDIVFTDYFGNKLSHEIELYNSEDGDLVAWVNVNSITSELILYMYYGNLSCNDQQNVPGTWDNSYKGVWHLNENPLDTIPQYKDSSKYGNDGTAYNMEIEDHVVGKINYAARLNEGYNNHPQEYIDCGSDTSIRITQDITISSWINCDTFINDKYFYWLCTDYGGAEFYSYINPGWWQGYDRMVWFRDEISYNIHDKDGSWPRNGWHYFVITDDTTTTRLYIDGYLRESAFSSHGSIGNSPLQIGSCEGRNNNMDAEIDEIRLSNNIRNNEWIFTEYNNQNNPLDFSKIGPEEPGV